MARGRRFIRSNNQRGGVGSFDPDARRMLAIESRHDPKDPPRDYLTGAEKKRNQQPAQPVVMPARPALCHCGSKEFYLRGVRWTCAACQPQQPAQPVEARQVVTMPANIPADEAAQLAQAWQLVNQKRAADGLAPLPAITKTKPVKELDKEERRRWGLFLEMQKHLTPYPPVKANPAPGEVEYKTYISVETARAIIRQLRKETIHPEKYKPVTFYSLMGIEAARRGSGTGGAWRLWVLFRALDTSGSGHIKRDDLRAFVLSLGVSRATFNRWYSDALRLEIFKEGYRRDGWYMYFVNAGIIGAALGCVDGAGPRVTMRAKDLIGNGWKARIFAAHESTFKGKPIARETIQKKYNVAKSTQLYREAVADVEIVTNIAKTNRSADQLAMLQEHDRNPRAYWIGRDGTINRRLPNSYIFDNATLSGRGRGKKVNRIIRGIHAQQQSSLSIMGQAQSFIDADETTDFIRVYNLTPDQTKATEKKLRKTGNNTIFSVYEYQRKAYRRRDVAIWEAVAV